MKIAKLKLKNFRGHVESEILFDHDFTAIIGKNDVGKSTILEALEIFFNNDTIKIDIEDCNIHSVQKEIEIEVSFELDRYNYTVDTVETNLKDEFLLNNGMLTIRKVWTCNGKSITAKSLKTFIIADYPNSVEPLVNLSITNLKKKLGDFEHKLNIDQVNKNKCSDIRLAIYSVLDNIELVTTVIPADKEDGKKIWDSLKNELPIFCLFLSDRQNKDSDKEVQDPLKAITKNALAELSNELEAVKADIKQRAEEIGQETLDKLREMNPDIAKVLSPEMSNKPWESLFSFTFNADDGIPINKRGSGVRRLIMLNYFRAEADRRNSGGGRSIIYAIEEPETSQHPDWQMKLIKSLIELSEKEDTQVLITTHSPNLTKMMYLKSIRFIKRVGSKLNIDEGDPSLLNDIRDTLGLLPVIDGQEGTKLRLIVCLEGPTDVKFLCKAGKLFGFDLEKDPRIALLTVGGSTVSDWVNRDCLQKFGKNEFHIYDRDEDLKYKNVVRELNSREGVFAIMTGSMSIESYYHPRSVIDSIPLAEGFIDLQGDWESKWSTMPVAKKLSSHLKQKSSNGLKENSVKKRFADYVSVTEVDLKELNVYEEVKEWFEKIDEMVS